MEIDTTTNSIIFIVPSFYTQAVIDPSLSVLIAGPKDDGNNDENSNDKNASKNYKSLLGIL